MYAGAGRASQNNINKNVSGVHACSSHNPPGTCSKPWEELVSRSRPWCVLVTIISPILLLKKHRREVKEHAEGHTASRQQSQDTNRAQDHKDKPAHPESSGPLCCSSPRHHPQTPLGIFQISRPYCRAGLRRFPKVMQLQRGLLPTYLLMKKLQGLGLGATLLPPAYFWGP